MNAGVRTDMGMHAASNETLPEQSLGEGTMLQEDIKR